MCLGGALRIRYVQGSISPPNNSYTKIYMDRKKDLIKGFKVSLGLGGLRASQLG